MIASGVGDAYIRRKTAESARPLCVVLRVSWIWGNPFPYGEVLHVPANLDCTENGFMSALSAHCGSMPRVGSVGKDGCIGAAEAGIRILYQRIVVTNLRQRYFPDFDLFFARIASSFY